MYGSRIFSKTSDTLNEEELKLIPQLMEIPSKGFFIHIFENLRTANLFLNLPSKFARGRFEKLLISIITDINNDLNLTLSRELLENFATSLLNLKDAYKAFDIEMKDYKGDPEKLLEIEKLLSSFYITIKPAIKALEISEQNLKERVKELTCIYGISKLAEDPNITIHNILQGTLELIHPAYQFPKITCARIIYENKEYRTEKFADTPWTQMVVKEISEKISTIQVNYLEDKSFLKEEEDLINDIGNRLKVIIEQKKAEQNLKERIKELTCVYRISKLAEDPNITIHNILQDTLELIHPAYQFPKITCARIIYENKEYKTENFSDTPWTQMVTKEISEKILKIQVNYLEDKSFLKEEEELINEIGNKLKKIIEQKEAEQKLKESEEKWRSLTEYSSDNIMTVDLNYNILFINHTIPSVTREEIIGKSLFSYIPEEFQESAKECFRRVLESGKPDQYYTDYTGSDGTNYFFEARIGPMMPEGKMVGFTISSSDITERKRAEEDLRTSEVKYRTLSKNIPGMVYRAKTDWSTEIITNSYDLCGYSIEEFDSQEINWFEIIHPDDKNKILNDSATMLKNSISLTQEYRIITKDGSTHWVEDYKTSFFNKDGSFKGIDGVVYDITERKKAEYKIKEQSEFLMNVLESLKHPFYVINVDDYTIELANSFAMPEKSSKVLTCHALTHKSEKPCKGVHNCPLEEVKKTKKPVVVEHIHYDENGNPNYFEVQAYPIFDNDGNVIQMIESSLNISERKKIEQELRDSEKKMKDILNTAQLVIYVKDLEGKYTFVNDLYETLFKIKKQEVIGLTDYDIFPEDMAKAFQVNDKKVIETKSSLKIEEYAPHDDGIHTYMSVKFPLKTEANEIFAVCGLSTDITERKKAEDKIKYAHSELNQILNTTVPMCVIDKNYNNIRVNNRFNSFYNLKVDEAYSKKCHEIRKGHRCFTPECTVKQILEGKEHIDYEIDKELSDGTKISYIITAFPYLNLEGEIIGVIETFTDITKRKKMEQKLKESEEKYRFMFETSPHSILIMDKKGKLRDLNPMAETTFQYTRKELIGRSFMRVKWFLPETMPMVVETFKTLINGNIPDPLKLQQRRKDGTYLWVYVLFSFMNVGGEELIQVIVEDISNIKEV